MILLVLIFLISSMPALQCSENKNILTMSSAVELALKHSPDLGALRYGIQADQSAAKSAKSGYLPTIDASSQLSREQGAHGISTQTIFSANQLIYSGSGPRQQYQKAKAVAACTELEKTVMANNIRKETEKAFLQAWLAQKQSVVANAIKTSSNTIFKMQKHQQKLKKLDREVWLKKTSEYADNIALADSYSDDKHIAYNTLSFLMGESIDLLNTNKKLSWHYKQKIAPLKPVETYLNAAITARPEIPKGLKRIAVEKWNTKILQGTRLPEIRLSAYSECDTQPASSTYIFINNGLPEIALNPNKNSIISTWSINLNIKWSLFDGLVTHYQEQQAQANKMKEMLAHEQQLLNIKREVHTAYLNYSKAYRQFKAQRLHLLQAANDFKLQQQKLALGKATKIDLVAAQTAWNKARFDWLSQRVLVAQNECDLIHACGYPENIC